VPGERLALVPVVKLEAEQSLQRLYTLKGLQMSKDVLSNIFRLRCVATLFQRFSVWLTRIA
jgi:hypothetical protein